jgi:hypothetical protein
MTSCLIRHRAFIVMDELRLEKERIFEDLHFKRSRDSVVGIATSYGLDDRGVGLRVPIGSRIFSSPDRSDWL